jgi:N-methylhydantoinase B/oxoprolinase/acetone carboxylase alpha subunit
LMVENGDIISIQTPGGGGFGKATGRLEESH